MEKKILIRRIAITVACMLCCILLIGVSVHAALSQSVKLTNNISITADGQVQSIVKVYQTSIQGKDAVTTLPQSEPTWGAEYFTKTQTENSANKAMPEIIFSQTVGINIYAYKIEMANKSTIAVDFAITSTAEANTEVDVWVGETYESLTKLENNAGVNFEKSEIAASTGTATYYIFVVANTALSDMNAVDSQEFNIDIVVDASSTN